MPSVRKSNMLKTAGAIAASTVVSKNTVASAAELKKQPGETKIVAVIGHDAWHNGVAWELGIRRVFASKPGFRIIAVRSSSAWSNDLIEDADLLIASKASVPDHIELGSDLIADTVEAGENFWSDATIDAIIRNVRGRGMGFMPLHCSAWARSPKMFDFIGVEPIMHNQVQPLWVHNLNKEHPVTSGMDNFMINLDEQFAVVVKSQYTDTLFETTAMHDKREAVGAWSLENGKGRIVGLLPGHTADAYNTVEYREILWRAAHWAMKKEIDVFPKG